MLPSFTKLPFTEASDFLREKVNLPTRTWTDLQRGMHSRAFVVAGTMKNELLSDLHQAVQKGIDEGTTLQEFRKDFDSIVQRNGWSFKQNPGWRAAVIYNTNLRTAFAAGSEAQMQRTKARRPWARYIGGLSLDPRPLHLQWDGTILPLDDPWWETHTPPNDWGCKCKKVSVSRRELDRNGWQVADKAPDDGNYKWKNPSTGETVMVPNGIGPSWDYNPGRAAWGQQQAVKSMQDFKKDGNKFEVLTKGDWKTENGPEQIPVAKPKTKLDFKIPKTQEGMETALNRILDGEEKIFSFEQKGFRYDFNVNAKALAEHLKDDPSRAAFLPLLPEVLEEPFEVWQAFERNRATGKVILRTRFVKALATETGDKGVLFVTDAANGQMEGLTLIPMRSITAMNTSRRGKLIFAEKK